jgi:flavin reductase (DIM6/NTAB) family NADH-FMN oxidoreductase RutF
MVTWINRATKGMTPPVIASAVTQARTSLTNIDLNKALTINITIEKTYENQCLSLIS